MTNEDIKSAIICYGELNKAIAKDDRAGIIAWGEVAFRVQHVFAEVGLPIDAALKMYSMTRRDEAADIVGKRYAA